ncbi:ADP-ribosylation factor-like protein 2 [Haliotis rubra]|uniref:ADP-ribosylation factor-like protein 2 n=1 Tax=Haliotis rubra TaxID=36100 RepID=UPI001EE50DE2|nr:ADP-ribosylation factor-like protein 2 [Haliotis rubra]
MGQYISMLPWLRKEVKVLMHGLDNAGKTSLLHRITSEGLQPTRHTLCESKWTLLYKNINVTLIDFEQRRRVYRRRFYYTHPDVVLFMVDSDDRARIQEAQEELRLTANYEDHKDIPFLVLANKQDRRDAMTVTEVAEALDFQNILKTHRANIIGCSVVSRQGLKDAMDWLIQDFRSPCEGSNTSPHNKETDAVTVRKRGAWSIFTYMAGIFGYFKNSSQNLNEFK